jgi:hypothetical protein
MNYKFVLNNSKINYKYTKIYILINVIYLILNLLIHDLPKNRSKLKKLLYKIEKNLKKHYFIIQ